MRTVIDALRYLLPAQVVGLKEQVIARPVPLARPLFGHGVAPSLAVVPAGSNQLQLNVIAHSLLSF